MSFSVGVLYSVASFLEQLQASPIDQDDFKKSFSRFAVASAEVVLSVSQDCGWIAVNTEGLIQVTPKGLKIIGCTDYTIRLRTQLVDMVAIYQPLWAKKLPNGRAEVSDFLPNDAHQCFSEAGLLSSWDDDLITWWDELAQVAKARKSSELMVIGRKAEKLSVEYEKSRTGIVPRWQSLESNFSGYDVLSCISNADETPLKIEVKGSTLSIKQAYFTITRNEWNTAKSSIHYCLHLWSLSANPINLMVVGKDEIQAHLPENKGEGGWETVRIPFSCFTKNLSGKCA